MVQPLGHKRLSYQLPEEENLPEEEKRLKQTDNSDFCSLLVKLETMIKNRKIKFDIYIYSITNFCLQTSHDWPTITILCKGLSVHSDPVSIHGTLMAMKTILDKLENIVAKQEFSELNLQCLAVGCLTQPK